MIGCQCRNSGGSIRRRSLRDRKWLIRSRSTGTRHVNHIDIVSDRRKVGMAGIRGNALVGFALVVLVLGFILVVDGAPFPAPKVNDCMSWEGCCPPKSNVAPIPFTFPTKLPMRTRRAAHLVDANYIAKYRNAYALMKKLPASDPRSLVAQARLHCAYCGAAFTFPKSQYGLDIHDGWFFFPWHRMFLYFHERILASLINDPTFTLPFWNWDNQSPTAPNPSVGAANTMPIYYTSPASNKNSLWNRNRNRCALPPNIIDLNSGGGCSNSSPQSLRTDNTRLMATQMRTATTPGLFFGSTYRFGWSGGMGGGNLEGSPHGTVHVFTGDPYASNPFDDMGNLDRAALDPLFYAHHANLDRLWQVWKTAGGRGNRVDISDKDYLNSQFIFFDENKKLVSIKVSDVLNTNNLRYSYEQVPNPWMTASSQMSSMSVDFTTGSMPPSTKCAPPNQDPNALIKKTLLLSKKQPTIFSTKPLTFKVRRVEPTGNSEEVLVFKEFSIDWTKTAQINAYLFYPMADGSSIDCMEFFGTFAHIPQANHRKKQRYTQSWTLGLSAKLEQLGLSRVSYVVVTLVQIDSLQTIQFASASVQIAT